MQFFLQAGNFILQVGDAGIAIKRLNNSLLWQYGSSINLKKIHYRSKMQDAQPDFAVLNLGIRTLRDMEDFGHFLLGNVSFFPDADDVPQNIVVHNISIEKPMGFWLILTVGQYNALYKTQC